MVNLKENDTLIQMLRESQVEGESGLKQFPMLLKKVLITGAWKERYISRLNKEQKFNSFAEFVETPPLEGFGSTIRQLQHLCRDDKAVLDLLDKETRGIKGKHHSSNRTMIGARGTTIDYGLSRLRKSKPTLHEKVISGELSVNAAMIKAGFRKKTITIELDKTKCVNAIKRHFSIEDVEWIKDNL